MDPLVATSHPHANLIPSLDDAATLVSLLLEPDHVVDGSLMPAAVSSAGPSNQDALGICAHWHSATQDVDFERKLLLRALLSSLPPQAIVLPSGCASLDEIDLAPLKVQSLLEGLGAGAKVDLNSSQYRWDLKQLPPKLAWSREEPTVRGGGRGGGKSVTPPWAGLSKRQLDVAAFEALLLALGPEAVMGSAGDTAGDSALPASGAAPSSGSQQSLASLARRVAEQLGIGSRQYTQLCTACLRPEAMRSRADQPSTGSGAATATAAGNTPSAPASDSDPPPSAAEGAAARSGLRQRLALLQATAPRDFCSDNAFFEWQERQAALLGASLHVLLSQLADEYDDPEQSP